MRLLLLELDTCPILSQNLKLDIWRDFLEWAIQHQDHLEPELGLCQNLGGVRSVIQLEVHDVCLVVCFEFDAIIAPVERLLPIREDRAGLVDLPRGRYEHVEGPRLSNLPLEV